jgi:hypothetical protein
LSTGKYPNVINVFLVLSVVRVEVECGRISHVAARLVGYNRDIVAYFVLIRITLRRVKRVAHSNIGRPGDASVGAIGVEQL